MTWVHVNHGWRGSESEGDARFVRELGKELHVKVKVLEAKEKPKKSESWEDAARRKRREIFQELAGKDGVVLTAHTADDLAETVLWRLCTGNAETGGGGIAVRQGVFIRPFLTFRKSLLQEYLREEGQAWREDRTNHEGRFLRSKMRQELMPMLEAIFPRSVEHLVELGLKAQGVKADRGEDPVRALIQASGLELRRTQWLEVEKFLRSGAARELFLPGGYRLVRERGQRGTSGRLVLEKIPGAGQ